LLLLAIEHDSVADSATPLADKVRAANRDCKNVTTTVVQCSVPIPCACGVDGSATGVHWVIAAYLKDEVPVTRCTQAVRCEPQSYGKTELLLEGLLFNFTTGQQLRL
jgi:hypothetical protein